MQKFLNFLTFTLVSALCGIIFIQPSTFAATIPDDAPIPSTTSVAQINDTTYDTLTAAITAAQPGDTITLLDDIIAPSTIIIDKPLTISGQNHQITSNSLAGTDAALLINTAEPVHIEYLTINTNTRAIAINNSVHHITIDHSTLNCDQRGITINTDANHDSILNVTNSVIQNRTVSNYDEDVPNNYTRGISIWELARSEINLENTTIQGFSYAIVVTASPEPYPGEHTKFTLDNCTLKGRAGLNYSRLQDYNITIKDSHIHGINNQTGPTERFGDIVIESSAQANMEIVNTKFTNFQNSQGLSNDNALQYFFDIRTSNNVINISGGTTMTDQSGKLPHGFYILSEAEHNDITITGGTYDFDVEKYVPSGYQVSQQNGLYTVTAKPTIKPPVVKPEAPTITLPEIDDDVSSSLDIGFANQDIADTQNILLKSLQESSLAENLPANSKISIAVQQDFLHSSQISPTDLVKISSALPSSGEIAQFFDLSIVVKSNGTKIGQLSTLSEPITFSITLPNSLLQTGRKFYIISLHDGETRKITATQNGNILTFPADQFSLYALAYTDADDTEKPGDETENPGDNDSGDLNGNGTTSGNGMGNSGNSLPQNPNTGNSSQNHGKNSSNCIGLVAIITVIIFLLGALIKICYNYIRRKCVRVV